jgi:beta-glucosidase
MDKSLPPDQRADMVIEQMTIDEKIQLVHGRQPGRGQVNPSNGGAGWIPGIPRLGIPDINMADSAVGVTRGAAMGRYSTLLPSTLAGAGSWDPKAAYRYGTVIGRELRDQGYNMSIGGGVNITREPRDGRNFEYNGEDPILAGTMVGQLMKGVQSQQIMGDIKHYALNDQETGRNIGNAILDERSMRETDLLAFEIGIRDSQAAGVMCAYNKIDGDWACENEFTLTKVLRKAFGFQGWVMSDWGGTHSTVKAAMAGLDQEMPGGTYFGESLKKNVESGDVPMARLNEMVHRILRSMFAVGVIDNPPRRRVPDVFQGLADAQYLAEQSLVLLKNTNGELPLAPSVKSIAIIGSHADVGVLSGGGSAQVDPPGGNAVVPPTMAVAGRGRGGFGGGRSGVYFPDSPLQAIHAKMPNSKVTFDAGTDPAAAAALAKASEVAIVFVNQPMAEGRDAATLALPDNQDALVEAVGAANPRTIVVLETGGPVTMPWVDHVHAVLAAFYPGIRGAEAIADILFGEVNPSGKLAVTFPKHDADVPHPQIAGMNLTPQPAPAPPAPTPGAAAPAGGGGRGRGLPPFDVPYSEGLKVGYKWYDAENKEPLFAFGHGLSYTTFAYSALKAVTDGNGLLVTFTVRNTGKRAGAEVAEVYASLPASTGEPPKRLIGWEKVTLAPGESHSVSIHVEPLYLSIFSEQRGGWQIAAGDYQIMAGGSSRSLPLKATVHEAGN